MTFSRDFFPSEPRFGGFGLLRRRGIRDTETEGLSPDYVLSFMLEKRALAGFRFEKGVILGPTSVAFYCPDKKLAIDYLTENHDIRRREEMEHDAVCANMGIIVLRFHKTQILERPDSVRNEILEALGG